LDYTPVFFEYNIPNERVDQHGDFFTYSSNINNLTLTPTSTLIGSIRDVKNWVDDSRRSARFIVLIIFVGLLSLVSSLL